LSTTPVATPTRPLGWNVDPDHPSASAHPVWFGAADRPLFGWIHRPANDLARGGVVLCPPVAKEYQAAHYTMRLLAERLAGLGFVVLRFDYDGTGDSDGNPDDGGRIDAWRAGIRDAVAFVRATGVASVALVGMRIGALLAATEAHAVDALVLWDPVPSGRAFVREQLAMAALTLNTPQPTDGSVESPWVVWSPEAVAELSALQLDETVQLPALTLVLGRDDNPLPAPFRRKLASPTVEWDDVPAQRELMEHMWIPQEGIARVAGWLDDRSPRARVVITPPAVAGEATVHDDHGRPVVETPLLMGTADLFGILTEAPGASGPVVVLVGGHVDHHVGPARLWVSLARRWAADGIRVLRLDFSGLGDSGVRPGQKDQLSFAPEAVEDLLEVAAAVSPDDPRNVVLAGFCAGGYSVIEAGIKLAPRAVLVLNPAVFFDPPETREGGAVDADRLAYQARPNWIKRLGRGPAVRAIRSRIPQWGYRLLDLAGVVRSPATGFALLVDRGVQTLVACGASDSEIYRRMAGRQIKSLSRSRLFVFEIVDGLTHALLTKNDRDACTRILTTYLTSSRAVGARDGGAGDGSPAGSMAEA
jgi:pimeloyl-ACP methyl ester carboxylesterase